MSTQPVGQPLSRPRLYALREIESTLVRVSRTRRTRVPSSGRLCGRAVATGRSIGGPVLEALHDAGLVRYVQAEPVSAWGAGYLIAEVTDKGYRLLDEAADRSSA